MTLKELKRDGNLVCEFKKLGFFDTRYCSLLLFYKRGDPTYCAIYELCGKFYFVHRVTYLEITECLGYNGAMQRFRDFITNAGV